MKYYAGQNRISTFILFLFFVNIFFFSGCTNTKREYKFSGRTMGTTYSISIISESKFDKDKIQSNVDSILVEINRQMSTYIKDSEISQFNRWNSKEPFLVSDEFAFVVKSALDIYQRTNGAFDITVMPLVDLWGFFIRHADEWRPPTEGSIQNILLNVGSHQIRVDGNYLIKTNPEVQIDVNAIAKGFGVDEVSEYLVDYGFDHCLVEIGGEVRCVGKNIYGEAWKIGIDKPEYNSVPGQDLASVISLDNQAMATSGDYRNYFTWENMMYSHAIDARTGYPVKMNVASATVIAPTCLQADALATALLVMGKHDSEKLIESLPEVSCIMIIRESGNQYQLVEIK